MWTFSTFEEEPRLSNYNVFIKMVGYVFHSWFFELGNVNDQNDSCLKSEAHWHSTLYIKSFWETTRQAKHIISKKNVL